jgi:hypothetical protein
LGKAASLGPLSRSLAALTLLWAGLAVVALVAPGLARTQWNRFLRPFEDVPPFSLTEFELAPGDVTVVYGSELEIRATVRGTPVEHLELILESAGGQEPALPMFPEPDGVWRAVLSRVVEPAEYFVRADRARSAKYHIQVATVPLIESARLRVVQPEYANRAPYEGPLPKDGISGLGGTKVEVFLRSNRPLRDGTLVLTQSSSAVRKDSPIQSAAKPAGGASLRMQPTEAGGQEVVGQFSISGDGKFECRVTDESGQTSQQSFSGNFVMLADQRPFLRLLEPPKMSLATPSATLPVTLAAEDDCGISRLQLFRSLNDSRPLPLDLSLPRRPPRRFEESAYLPLDKYGLEPGDVIKLFGRVEDNDPAGAKGAESPLATVRIVSQEEFERMLMARKGIDAVLAKYYAARRRMESMAKQIDDLRKRLEKLPADARASEEIRRELDKLRESMQNEAEEIRKSAEHPLPIDLDKNLAPQLKDLAKLTDEMAGELQKLRQDKDLLNKKLGGKLDELAKQLSASRRQYEKNVTAGLEYFEAVFPLLVDRERYAMLAVWQREFAERLASLKGRERDDSPSLKARMRDLEQEQQQILDALSKLLDDIQAHSEKLPDLPELKELRETAQKFVVALHNSGAAEVMTAAESALADFAPTRGYEKAKQAADILAKFLSQCHGMGNCAGNRLTFHPSLCNSLGNSVAQLLAAMGGQGSNSGGGGFGMSGFGMGGAEGSIGLYGGLPAMFGRDGERGDAQEVRAASGAGQGRGSPHGENPDEAGADEKFAPGAAAGASEGSVPPRYRRQVGQYFQRIAEETGETGK